MIDGNTSDGYHTFNELYEHRTALFAALMNCNNHYAWKSKKHSDGSEWEGWFICGMTLPTGDISYHLPNNMWEYCKCDTLERGLEWDGHTANDVVTRLKNWALTL